MAYNAHCAASGQQAEEDDSESIVEVRPLPSMLNSNTHTDKLLEAIKDCFNIRLSKSAFHGAYCSNFLG